jgi:hypothetical protein
MTGELKQMIANVRSEWRRTILDYINGVNKGIIEGDEEDFFERIDKFEAYLASIDEPVAHQVPPLGMSITDDQPVQDRFGGTPPPTQGKRYTTTANPEPVAKDDGQPGIE